MRSRPGGRNAIRLADRCVFTTPGTMTMYRERYPDNANVFRVVPNGFDERYFLYFEDVDLCLRLQREGWKVVYHPGATMTHEHRRESGRRGLNRRKYQHLRSWAKFQWKHFRLDTGRSVR